jgi:hypothetical protein
MADHPILFSAPMVRALLAGTKTQTRRAVKLQPTFRNDHLATDLRALLDRCPYCQPGDRLWVREAWAPEQYDANATTINEIDASVSRPAYRATFDHEPVYVWKPSIHMPRALSRITLEVTDVRVERLQDICEADVWAEGCRVEMFPDAAKGGTFKLRYRRLWESINGAGSWEANPWVWVVEFKRSA